MNYVELEQVLKVTDICNIIGTKKGFSDNVFIANRAVNRNLYEWKNIKFHCPGLDRTIIRGELPSEVVNYIKVRFNRDFLDSAGKNIYHVFSKECLLVLILALKDYYSCKEGLNSNELSKYNEIRRMDK